MNKENKSFFAKLKEGLIKTKKNLTDQIEGVIFQHKKINDNFLDELEEILITSTWALKQPWTLLNTSRKKQRKEN